MGGIGEGRRRLVGKIMGVSGEDFGTLIFCRIKIIVRVSFLLL